MKGVYLNSTTQQCVCDLFDSEGTEGSSLKMKCCEYSTIHLGETFLSVDDSERSIFESVVPVKASPIIPAALIAFEMPEVSFLTDRAPPERRLYHLFSSRKIDPAPCLG